MTVIIEKRKLYWKIKNFTTDAVNKYSENDFIDSKSFVIFIDGNKTEWTFSFYPKKADYCGFYIKKWHEDHEGIFINGKLLIHQTENTMKEILTFDIKPSNFSKGNSWGCNKLIETNEFFENEYLDDDVLTLAIEIELHQESASSRNLQVVSMPFDKFFNSSVFSDFTIECSDKEKIPVHRVVIAGRSLVFDAMLETDMIENQTGEVPVKDVSSPVMLEILRFIYTGDVEKLDELADEILYAAEKYDLGDLKTWCAEELIKQLNNDNVLETLTLAHQCNEEWLMDECLKYVVKKFDEISEDKKKWKELSVELNLKIMHALNNKQAIELVNSL